MFRIWGLTKSVQSFLVAAMKRWEIITILILTFLFSGLVLVYHSVIHRHHETSTLSNLQQNNENRMKTLSRQSPSTKIINETTQYISKSNISLHDVHKFSRSRPIQRISPSERIVIFDWPLDSDLVSYINYKSIESFLACCYTPETKIEIMIIGPNKANYYKVNKLLSKHTFSKYTKKGYFLQPIVHYSVESLFAYTNRGTPTRFNITFGERYLDYEFDVCCRDVLAKKLNAAIKEMPIHVWMFGRLARLYTHGGEFYDLSWFHQERISGAVDEPMNQGASIYNFCYRTNEKSDIEILPPPPETPEKLVQFLSDILSHPDQKHSTLSSIYTQESLFSCSTSAAMYFPVVRHPVLSCVLEEYNSDASQLLTCLRNPILATLSKALRTYYEGVCIKVQMDECFHKNQLFNDFDSSSRIVKAPSLATSEKDSLTPIPVKNAALVWLGPFSVSGEWVTPKEGSYLETKIINNNRLIKSYMDSYNLKKYQRVSNSSTVCSHYASFDTYDSKYKRQASLSCSLNFVLPGFMKAGTSYLFDMISKHPQILHTLKGVIFKETGCYYGEIISDSNHSFERMNCFPFVEKEDGLMFGDGTVYYVHRFPSAEFMRMENPYLKTIILIRDPIDRSCSHHRFSYIQFSANGIPDFNDVVDIALSPGSRLQYLHDLALDALNEYLRITDPLYFQHRRYILRSKPDNTSAMDKFLRAFHAPGPLTMSRQYERCYNAFLPSLYFPFIAIWENIFGSSNILVIEGERITPSRSRERLLPTRHATISPQVISYTGFTMDRTLEDEIGDVFRFIGLHQLRSIPPSYEHKTRVTWKPEHEMNETSKTRMEKFFYPFNEMLKIYLQRRRSTHTTQ